MQKSKKKSQNTADGEYDSEKLNITVDRSFYLLITTWYHIVWSSAVR